MNSFNEEMMGGKFNLSSLDDNSSKDENAGNGEQELNKTYNEAWQGNANGVMSRRVQELFSSDFADKVPAMMAEIKASSEDKKFPGESALSMAAGFEAAEYIHKDEKGTETSVSSEDIVKDILSEDFAVLKDYIVSRDGVKANASRIGDKERAQEVADFLVEGFQGVKNEIGLYPNSKNINEISIQFGSLLKQESLSTQEVASVLLTNIKKQLESKEVKDSALEVQVANVKRNINYANEKGVFVDRNQIARLQKLVLKSGDKTLVTEAKQLIKDAGALNEIRAEKVA